MQRTAKDISGLLGLLAILAGIALGVAEMNTAAVLAVLGGAVLVAYYLFTGDHLYLFNHRD